MTALAAVSPLTSNLDQLKTRLKATWMAGDYDIFSRYLETDAYLFYRRLDVQNDAKLLDVACGTGQLALIAARHGLEVSGCDIARNWIERARDRASAEGLKANFEEGDAEALPYADASFDVVTSLVGAMFAPQPDLVASEMVRVTRPGGKIAMANWTPQGFVGQMFKTIAKYIAPNGMPSPVLWGDEATVRERFKEGVLDLKCTLRFYQFEYPFGPETVVQFFRDTYGPMAKAFASLDTEGQEKLTKELVELWSSHNRHPRQGTLVDSEYLEVIAIRDTRTDVAGSRSSLQVVNQRAALLADRIEEGAQRMIAFAERMSDAEWKTPITEGGKPGRTAGMIVHHVASVYPIEVELAQAIAGGNAVTQVTWDAVAQLNAKHAADSASVSKAEALDLLRKNSAEAATKVRAFTDEQLDRAAPFSLSFGAPVTAQFVLEDHAVRHSWHHLERLRKAFGCPGGNPEAPAA
jgi:ubiquinone/menaquinone biosynthesis C-methylase UbiE